MSMSTPTNRRSVFNRLPLIAFLIVLGAVSIGAYWRWRSPIHKSLDRILVGSLSATLPPPAVAVARGDHGNAPEAGHAHDHAGQAEHASLELSEQARRSLGLREGEVALTTFCRTISVPAIVPSR